MIGSRIKPSRGDRFEILKNLYNVKSKVIDCKNQYDTYPVLSEAFSEYEIQNDKEKAYKFINRVNGKNVFVNASIENIEEDIEIDDWYINKNVIYPIK